MLMPEIASARKVRNLPAIQPLPEQKRPRIARSQKLRAGASPCFKALQAILLHSLVQEPF
jgi:hypothetical protein